MEFEEIYTRFSPGIFRVCMGFVNDHDEAKDLVQETFIAVWKNLSSFRGEANVSTWIYRIATNNCLRHIERSKRKKTEPLPDQHPDSIDQSKEEKLNYLYQCISELEETDRIIISLVLEELPQDQAKLIRFYNRTQKVGIIISSIGLLLYLYEGVYEQGWLLYVAYVGALSWILLCWFVIRPRAFNRKSKAIHVTIEKIESISNQLQISK